ncbi:hypothetical protein B0H13DRAFT_2657825 [Mycena leptocephala]|nr:hypothetical protein B0H13DRAFT_2657825 [Mycena leptocephala]
MAPTTTTVRPALSRALLALAPASPQAPRTCPRAPRPRSICPRPPARPDPYSERHPYMPPWVHSASPAPAAAQSPGARPRARARPGPGSGSAPARAGGRTGDIPASILIPACVDAVKGHKSPLTGLTGTGKPVYVIGAGALCTTAGGLAANLGCRGRVGTRFVAAVEANAPKKHKELICSAGFEDAVSILIFTGRTPYIEDWNLNR